jgi:hypothetical protein
MNSFGGTGLWNEGDGFYYDQLHVNGRVVPMRTRSMVGIIPLFAVEVLEAQALERLPGFKKRMDWFLANRRDLARHISYLERSPERGHEHRLLAVPSRERLTRVLRYVLDESEFLAPYGVRALSRVHKDQPCATRTGRTSSSSTNTSTATTVAGSAPATRRVGRRSSCPAWRKSPAPARPAGCGTTGDTQGGAGATLSVWRQGASP